ncbi:acetolactate synthase-1/2/3 large subunit [Arthrobacter bambusae]|uniref:Acetolactate synthase-1/2/3 large subunit n=1 Tax=Arthrobacter bambusae TaxID=1338426 RepID=A0ABV2P0Z0_9MICC
MFSTQQTVSDAIADVVAQQCDVVFGLMGNGNAHLVSSLTTRGTNFISSRHESGAVAMADAYYRASGKATVATATYGAGFTNTLTALTEARMARIPLVLIVGDAPSVRRPIDIDQEMVAHGLGVETLTVTAASARVTTERAFEFARHNSTPVVLAIPYDLAAAEAEPSVSLVPQPDVGRNDPNNKDIEHVALLLRGAERPLILGGRGAWESGAAEVLREIGDDIGALFATSVMARNLFNSPWDLGIAGGFSRKGALALLRQSDVVLAVGASLNDFQMRYGTLFPSVQSLVQVDTQAQRTHPCVTDHVQADAYDFSSKLLRVLQASPPRPGRSWRDREASVATKEIFNETPVPEIAEDGRLDPRPFAQALERILPVNRTIVQDGGHFLGWMPMYATVPDPRSLILSGTAYQVIGLGFPSAVGAAAARPEHTTVLISGDGGGLMALPDLETMIRTVKSGVVVVFNDAAYGAEIHQYASRGLDDTAMLIDEIDFAAVGRALGAQGIKATSLADLDVLQEWVSAGAKGVFVLDIPISRAVVADYMLESLRPRARKATTSVTESR